MSALEKQPKSWFAIDLVVEQEAREAAEYGLMEAAALGTETQDAENNTLRVTGYFDELPNRELVRSKLQEALQIYNSPSSSLQRMDLREVPDEDWLAEWKKNWQPIVTGRFIIAPPWNNEPVTSERSLIIIEPGMAFGTGTHETTRLCLQAIEKHYEGGSFLDVGTGTGILAIAAAKVFPAARVEAYDIDPEAVAIAVENARLNSVEQIVFRAGTIDDSTQSAEMVCANLTADVIVDLMPALLGVTCGRLVLSGILRSQVNTVLDRVREGGGPEPIEIADDGEWSAIIL
ncbi:MAG TPA: 50S ribosomal protein L11 methyltransferase [Pyrinomonadaceae bacterium]|nr:50S ribosomal protein L11 methyltransferase [Pyrinomonadaceae bacterium]